MPDPPIIKSPPKNSIKKDESKIDFKSEDNEFEKGNHTMNLNTSDLSSGIYYVSLEINGAKETKKLVINK